MEVIVRVIGVILRIINALLAPYFWLRTRNGKGVPGIRDPILMKSVVELTQAIRKGELTSEQIVKSYVARIQEVNPLINAVVEERFQAALDDARKVDKDIADARQNGKLSELFADKPLLGVPFTVKESCSLAGLSNAVGCLEHSGRRAASDGAAVRRLRRAGAVPLLASNTPELCLGWETSNLITGTTNNPYCLTRTAGGSSGGEAALVASGASPFGVGSDIAGSIRIPAAHCGVLGHKPTPGIIPIGGHIPTLEDEKFEKFLVVGPICRFADDLPLLLSVMSSEARLLRLHEPVDISQLRVYCLPVICRSVALADVGSAVRAGVRRAGQCLQAAGATLCHENFEELEDAVEMSVSMFFEMKDIPNMLLDPANPKVERSLPLELAKSWAGLGARSAQALAFAHLARTQLHIPRRARPRYRDMAHSLKAKLLRALGETGVLVMPACGPAHAHGRSWALASLAAYTMLFNVLGLPAAAAPLHRAHRLPTAVQIVAAPNQDRLCVAVARELERGLGGWRPPR